MAAERARRQIKRPTRFEDDDVYWDLGPLTPRRYVYRLLKRKDVTRDLVLRQIWLFWPEDQSWYKAQVREVNPKSTRLYVHYSEEDQYEEIIAADLIREGHIALMEERPVGAPLRQGDIPVDEADRETAVYLPDDEDSGDECPQDVEDENYKASEDESEDGGSADEEFEATDSDEERRIRGERLKAAAARAAARKGHAQVNRASKRYTEGSADDSASKKQRIDGSSGPVDGVKAAEDFKTAVLGALIRQLAPGSKHLASAPSHPGPGSIRPGSKPLSSRVSASAAAAQQEQDIRRRAREQLVAALQVAADELRREAIVDEAHIAVPGDVGVAVELALYKANGGLSKEYKTKFRSLVFNLKDPSNPDLRARVLQGELAPEALVALSAAELASREVSAARQKKAEEMAKAKFLDEETAAKFSTAAAAALKDQHQAALSKVGAKLLATQDQLNDKGPGGTAGQPDAMDTSEEHENGGGVHAAGGGGANGDGNHQAGADLLHAGSSGLLEPGGSFLLDKTASGSLVPVSNISGLGGRANSTDVQLMGRTSNNGSLDGIGGTTPLDMGSRSASRPAAKVVSLKPAAITPLPAAPASKLTIPEDEEYNPDDLIVGEEGDAGVGSQKSHQSGKKDTPTHKPTSRTPTGGTPSSLERHHSREHHQPTPSGRAAAEEYLDDLAPVVSRPDSTTTPTPPGTQVWQGILHAPESGPVSTAVLVVGGLQDIGSALPPHNPQVPHDLEVKGTLRLDKVEEFMEELRARSRSRTASLGLMKPSPLSSAGQPHGENGSQPTGNLNKLIAFYAAKQRAGVFHPCQGMEAYLLPPSKLARRLLLTARLVAAPQTAKAVPTDVPEGHLLIAFVHRRDWRPPTARQAPPAAAAAAAAATQQLSTQPSYHAPDPRQQSLHSYAADPRHVQSDSALLGQPSVAPPTPQTALSEQQQRQQHPTPPHLASPGAAHEPSMQQQHMPQAASLPASYDLDTPQNEGASQQQESAQQPNPSNPALASLLASLAPALQTAPPQDQQQQQQQAYMQSPQQHDQQLHLQQPQLHHEHPPQQHQQPQPQDYQQGQPQAAPPALDVGALSALASALQGLPGLQAPPQQPQPQQQQQILILPGGQHVVTGPQAGGGPVVVMQPDGTYAIVGAEGLQGMLVLPQGADTAAAPPAAHQPQPQAWPPQPHGPPQALHGDPDAHHPQQGYHHWEQQEREPSPHHHGQAPPPYYGEHYDDHGRHGGPPQHRQPPPGYHHDRPPQDRSGRMDYYGRGGGRDGRPPFRMDRDRERMDRERGREWGGGRGPRHEPMRRDDRTRGPHRGRGYH